MKVKIKTKEEIKKYPNGYGITDFYCPKDAKYIFVPEMFKFCGKIFEAKKIIGDSYLLYDKNGNEIKGKNYPNLYWEEWMFDEAKEVDENGNYLLFY